jgi:bacteriorhodopsin
MTVGWMAVIGISMTKPRHSRIFHYISAGLLMVASVAYFSMGSNLGFVPIAVEYQRPDPRVSGQYRSIFYVRYIDW